MAQPVNVFVVDTHAIYRRGLVASLELLDEVDAVDEADGAEPPGRTRRSTLPTS